VRGKFAFAYIALYVSRAHPHFPGVASVGQAHKFALLILTFNNNLGSVTLVKKIAGKHLAPVNGSGSPQLERALQ
jgi:hypothetical protein